MIAGMFKEEGHMNYKEEMQELLRKHNIVTE